MYCVECGQLVDVGHRSWCCTSIPGYQSNEDKLRNELKVATEKIQTLEIKNDEHLRIMSTLYSLLSLVFHRHLPRNLESLGKDIEKILATAEPMLQPWWRKDCHKREIP